VGAGKTAVAHQLVRSPEGPTAYIEGDLYWRFIVKPRRDGDAARAFRTVMRAMIASARHFKRDGYDVVLDFSIPPWYLDATRALLTGEPFDYVVICPSEAVCASRAALRDEGRIDDYAPYRDLYLSFDPEDRHAIADDESDPETIARLVRSSLSSGCFRVE